jgi:Flp pilus assembly protein TadB
MNPQQQRPELAGSGTGLGAQATGLLGRILTVAVGALLVVAALVFSLLVLAIAAAGALLAAGYLWWSTRQLRWRMREHPPGGRVIEGEAVRDDLQ